MEDKRKGGLLPQNPYTHPTWQRNISMDKTLAIENS